MALLPMTAPSAASGCIGFMNAALGVRFLPVFLADFRAVVLRAGFRAVFLADFLELFFRVVAIACLPVWVRTLRAAEPAELPRPTLHDGARDAIGKWPFSEGKCRFSPEKGRFSPGNRLFSLGSGLFSACTCRPTVVPTLLPSGVRSCSLLPLVPASLRSS